MHTHTPPIRKHLHAVIIYSSSVAGNLLYISTSLEAKETKLESFLICLKSKTSREFGVPVLWRSLEPFLGLPRNDTWGAWTYEQRSKWTQALKFRMEHTLALCVSTHL